MELSCWNFDQGKAPPSGGTINVPCFRAEDPGDLGEGSPGKCLRTGEIGVLKTSHALRESPKSGYFLKNPPLLWDIILTG